MLSSESCIYLVYLGAGVASEGYEICNVLKAKKHGVELLLWEVYPSDCRCACLVTSEKAQSGAFPFSYFRFVSSFTIRNRMMSFRSSSISFVMLCRDFHPIHNMPELALLV